jgi:hypothetical protein
LCIGQEYILDRRQSGFLLNILLNIAFRQTTAANPASGLVGLLPIGQDYFSTGFSIQQKM